VVLKLAARLQIVLRKLPVDQVPPGIEILGASIAVVDVIGVLPHIASEEGDKLGLGNHGSGIVSVDDLQLVILLVENKPGPSRGKVASCLLAELLLEGLERSPASNDLIVHQASGLTTSLG